MVIASLNIWGAAPNWAARREIITRAIPDLDLFLIQQVRRTRDSDQAGELAHKLKLAYRAIEFNGDDAVAILSSHPLADIETYDLSTTGKANALLAANLIDGNKSQYGIINVCLSDRSTKERQRQFQQVINFAERYDRFIIGGSLNLTHDQLGLDSRLTSAPNNQPTWPLASREERQRALGDKRPVANDQPRKIDYLIGKNINWNHGRRIIASELNISGSNHAILLAEF